MMPMKPIGPPSETAAPVASEALRNASRCARHDVHALGRRGLGADAQQVQRARQHREHREGDDDERQRGDDREVVGHVEPAHHPADGAQRLGEVREVLHEQDQRREERVQRDAGEQQHVGRQPAPLRRGERIDDAGRDERAGKAGQRNRRDAQQAQLELHRHREHRAERRAGRDAERERRGQGIAQQRLQHDARRGQGGADQRAGQHARQSAPRRRSARRRCRLPRDRAIERARQRDRRAADRRRPQHHRDREHREGGDDGDDAAADAHREIPPATGHDRHVAGRAVHLHVGLDVVERLDVLRRQHVRGGPGGQDAAVAHQDQLAADRRGEVQVVRRDRHRHAVLLVEARQQRRDFELIAEIERRGRLVEQAAAAPTARSAAAITTRCFSPPLSS